MTCCATLFNGDKPVYNKQQGDKGYEIREEALLQLLPFVGCNLPRVQHAALMSLERMAEDQSPGMSFLFWLFVGGHVFSSTLFCEEA